MTLSVRHTALAILLTALAFGDLPAQQDSLLQHGIRLSSEGRYADGVVALLKAGADTGSAFGRAQLGLAYSRLNDFPNARRLLAEAVHLDSTDVDLLFQYALFLHQNLVLPGALTIYRRVLKLDSMHGPAWFQLAQISRAMQEPVDDVRRYYRTSIRLNPDDYLAYYFLGSSLADSSETRHEGELFLHRSADLNPYFLPTIERLGSYYSSLRKDSLAAEEFAKAVHLRPRNPDFWFYLGESLRKMRRTDSAIVCFQTAMAIDSTQSMYVGQLGYAYVQARQYYDAVRSYQRAIELEPDNVQFYRNLAIAYERLGDVDAASDAYASAVQALEPSQFADLYNQIGHVRYRAHQYPAAGRAYRKALSFDPTNHETVFFLALVLDQTEDYAGAFRRYREFLRLLPPGDSLNARTSLARTRIASLEKLLARPE